MKGLLSGLNEKMFINVYTQLLREINVSCLPDHIYSLSFGDATQKPSDSGTLYTLMRLPSDQLEYVAHSLLTKVNSS